MSDLQYQVYAAVAARGYRDGWTPEEFVRRQFLKSVEELGECFRHLFDGRLPPAEEMADVIIPLLAAAEVMEMDLERVILEKAVGDVKRGVRSLNGSSADLRRCAQSSMNNR